MGADEIISSMRTDVANEVRRLTDGTGVTAVYDSVGKATFEQGLNCLHPRGYMVLYGASSGPVAPVSPNVLLAKGSLFMTRVNSQDYIRTPTEFLARTTDLFTWIRTGELKVSIGQTYALRNAAQAHRDLESRSTTGKLLLLPNEQETRSSL